MFDLVIIGHIGYENIFEDKGVTTYTGGAAYYSAVPASLYSKKIGIVSKIGSDFDFVKIKDLGINTEGIVIDKERGSSQFSLRYNKDNFEERDFRGELNAGENIQLKDMPAGYLKAKFFHIATAPPLQQIEWINFLRSRTKAKLSIDTVEQYIEWFRFDVIKALSLSDIIFINRREKELIGKLHEKIIILKKGPDGAEYIVKGKSVYSIPAPKAKVVDPTGSGDVLAGVFLTLMAQSGGNYKKSLDFAVKVASKAVTNYGVDFLLD